MSGRNDLSTALAYSASGRPFKLRTVINGIRTVIKLYRRV